MKSLTQILSNFKTAICKMDAKAYHYEKPRSKTAPYAVWAETGESDSFDSDNHRGEQQIECVLEFYTKTEFDPDIDTIQSILDENTAGWSLDAVQYEDETKLIHYSWSFRLV